VLKNKELYVCPSPLQGRKDTQTKCQRYTLEGTVIWCTFTVISTPDAHEHDFLLRDPFT